MLHHLGSRFYFFQLLFPLLIVDDDVFNLPAQEAVVAKEIGKVETVAEQVVVRLHIEVVEEAGSRLSPSLHPGREQTGQLQTALLVGTPAEAASQGVALQGYQRRLVIVGPVVVLLTIDIYNLVLALHGIVEVGHGGGHTLLLGSEVFQQFQVLG